MPLASSISVWLSPASTPHIRPRQKHPIVFAVQNSKLQMAQHLKFFIWHQVLNLTGDTELLIDSSHEFNMTDTPEDPYLCWTGVRVARASFAYAGSQPWSRATRAKKGKSSWRTTAQQTTSWSTLRSEEVAKRRFSWPL